MDDIIKQIGSYIQDYLFEHDDLSIKGLGTFTVNEIDAQIDNRTNNISPKKRVLSFSGVANDTTKNFYEFVAKKTGKYAAAIEIYVDRFISDVRRKLDNKEDVEIEGLGILSAKDIGDYTFTSNPRLNLLKSTIGLEPVELPKPIEKPEVKPIIEKPIEIPKVEKEPIKTHKFEKTLEEKTIADNIKPEEKVTVAEVLFDDIKSFKDLHQKTFGKESGVVESPQKEVIETTSSKKTMKEVLEENAKDIQQKQESKTTRRRFEWEEDEPKKVVNKEPRRNKGGAWQWLLPIAIILLFLMLWQIATTDKPLNEMAPFSWFMGSSNDNTIANNQNADTNNAQIVNDGESSNDKTSDEIDYTSEENNTENSDNSNNTGNSETSQSSNDENDGANNSNASETSTNQQTDETTKPEEVKSTPSTRGLPVPNEASSFNALVNENVPQGYHLVIGAFGNQNNALKTINKLRKRGYNAYVIKNKNGLYQCMVYAGTKRSDAQAKLSDVQSNIEKGAWIYKHK